MKSGTRLKHLFKTIEDLGNKVSDSFLFYPETSIYMSEDIEFPCISYRIYERQPDAKRSGYKPQFKRQEDNPNQSNSNILTYSQQFQTIIEFVIWGRSYESVDNKRHWFEEFIIRHTKKIREEGMLEIFFIEQLDDQVEEIQDNYFVKQTLHYHVKNERVVEKTVGNIEDITTEYQGSNYQAIRDKLNN